MRAVDFQAWEYQADASFRKVSYRYEGGERDGWRILREGKKYLDDLQVLRCKIVGYWYCARFEVVLDTIEADGFRLREAYEERRQIRTWLKILWLGIWIPVQHGFQQLKTTSPEIAE